ncbi:histone-lysine N-methyltransferase PRDM9-like isoform X2 [Trichomycterus rosablanca]
MDASLTSDEETNPVEQQNEGFLMKPIKIEDEDGYICVRTFSTEEQVTHVEQQNEGFIMKPVKVEEAEDEDYLYCEECRSFFINKCELHGAALFIPDSPVPIGVSDRARQTLPPALELQESDIPNAALGVFNKGETLPVGAHFGPYQGELVFREEAVNSRYSWVIYRSEQCEEFIDARRETHANWMRYVNCAGNDEENNLVAFQYQGGIFYRCCRPIKAGQELLVWYDETYAKDLGIAFERMWRMKCSAEESESFSCSLCVFSFTSQTFLHKHIRSRHHEEYLRMLKSGEIRYEDLMPSPSSCGQYTSSGCVAESSSVKQMWIEIHHCLECDMSFTDPDLLKTHQRVHAEPEEFHCLECGSSFTDLNLLESHQLVHSEQDQEEYQCSECGRSFTQKCAIDRHQCNQSEEKPYYCSQCGKSFNYKSHLKQHQHIHTGEKPYPCSYCDMSFYHKGHLKQHQRIHTGEKPYQCSQCEKRFTQKSALTIHQRIHTGEKPYHCAQCGKSFNRKSHLSLHQRIHTGEKPYQCSQCKKCFTHKSTLKQHQRVHTNLKPFHCFQCDKCFSRKSHLIRHQHVHAGDKTGAVLTAWEEFYSTEEQ